VRSAKSARVRSSSTWKRSNRFTRPVPTISFKRLEKADYRGLVLFNRERWAGAETELKGHSTRLAKRGKFPLPPHRMMGANNLNLIEVT